MSRTCAQLSIAIALGTIVVSLGVLLVAALGFDPRSTALAWALIVAWFALGLLALPLHQDLFHWYRRRGRELSKLIWPATPRWLKLTAGATCVAGLALSIYVDRGLPPAGPEPQLVLVAALGLCWCSLVIGTAYPLLLLNDGRVGPELDGRRGSS